MSHPGEPWGTHEPTWPRNSPPGSLEDVAVLLKHVRQEALKLALKGVPLPAEDEER